MKEASSNEIMAVAMANVVDLPRFDHLNKTKRKKGMHTCTYARCWTKNVLPLSSMCVDHYYTAQVGKYLDEYRQIVEELDDVDVEQKYGRLHDMVVDLTMKSAAWRLDALLLAVLWDTPSGDLNTLEIMIKESPEMSAWYKSKRLSKANAAGYL